jgi:hypothetical protein
MHRSAPNELFPIRPLPTIPVERASMSRGGQYSVLDEERTEDRRATDPDLAAADAVDRPAHPPEELFGMRPTEHVALPVQRNNLYIAVAAFVLLLLLALFATFFRLRLKLEHGDDVEVRAPATRTDSVLVH